MWFDDDYRTEYSHNGSLVPGSTKSLSGLPRATNILSPGPAEYQKGVLFSVRPQSVTQSEHKTGRNDLQTTCYAVAFVFKVLAGIYLTEPRNDRS
jgi:hypothetical protein